MAGIPAEVATTLARGVGAYLRAKPATELPPKLRRFQSFRPQGLAPHRAALIAALDDDGIRARVLEWLDEKPKIGKREAEVLRIAAERADGWEEQLAGRAPEREKQSRSTGDGAALDREKDKTRRARDDARRARVDGEETARKLRAEITALKAARDESRTLAGKTAKERDRALAEAERAQENLDRERRKAKTAVDKAREAAEASKQELKEVRRELQRTRREQQRLEGKLDALKASTTTGSKGKTTSRQPKGPRKPLPVPKGRFADAAETLEEWLRTPNVRLLVDGYNASMSEAGFARMDLATQRDRLVDGLRKLARRTQVKTMVVFDGSDVTTSSRKPRGPVTVDYSAPDEIADDHLIALLETMPQHPVVVATNDKELQGRAAKLGATIATSEQLLALLR